MARLVLEHFKPLLIEPPDFGDPKLNGWAKQLVEQVNYVMLRTLQANMDRIEATIAGTTGSIYIKDLVFKGGNYDWKMTPSGDKLILTYNDVVIKEDEGV